MNKFLAAGSALALAAVTVVGVAAPANAQPWPYYNHHYYQHYPHYYNANPAGVGIAAGILGFAAGAAIANSRNHVYAYDDGHVQACLDNYRSYDVRSDTYLGYDGYRHRCEL